MEIMQNIETMSADLIKEETVEGSKDTGSAVQNVMSGIVNGNFDDMSEDFEHDGCKDLTKLSAHLESDGVQGPLDVSVNKQSYKKIGESLRNECVKSNVNRAYDTVKEKRNAVNMQNENQNPQGGTKTREKDSGGKNEAVIDEITKDSPESVDKLMDSRETPWGWVVVVASFFVHIFTYGICWSAGIFNLIFLEAFEAPKAVTSWAGALSMATMFAAGPLASVLTNKYDCRRVTIFGGLVMALGLGITFFASSIYFIMVSFGIITGFGAGLCYIPAVAIVSYYFDRRRSFAIGLAVSGIGLGSFGFPPLIRFLYHEYGWQGSFLVLAALILNICVCGALMRPVRVKEIDDAEKFKLMDLSVFRNYGFILLCVNNVLVCFGLSVVYIHLAAYSESKGTDPERSSLLMSAIGISNLVGRVVFGSLGQFRRLDVSVMYGVAFALSGLAIILMPALHGYVLRMVLGSLFGMLSGCFGTLLVPILAALVGLHRFSNAYGLLLIFEGLGALSGAPFAGWLFDMAQQYDVSLFVGGGFIALSSTFIVGPFIKIRSDAKNDVMELQVDDLQVIEEKGKLDGSITT